MREHQKNLGPSGVTLVAMRDELLQREERASLLHAELDDLAGQTGFRLDKRFDMPANNMTLVWSRRV